LALDATQISRWMQSRFSSLLSNKDKTTFLLHLLTLPTTVLRDQVWTLHVANQCSLSMGLVFGRISEEVPQHTVLLSGNGYEVRSYPTQVAAVYSPSAQTEAKTPNQMSGISFRALAAYYGILSKPAQSPVDDAAVEPIAMTAPVLIGLPEKSFSPAMTDDSSGKEEILEHMTFLLPAKYKSVADAPVPSSPDISLVQLPVRITAAITFSGNLRPQLIREKAIQLREMLEKDNIATVGDMPVVAGYNPPFAVPWLKTNEVLLNVDRSSLPGSVVALSATNSPSAAS
jgi:SOUL heme-binding protein